MSKRKSKGGAAGCTMIAALGTLKDPIRTEDLSDEHLNQIGRFLGLPPATAEEHARLRAFCRWMRERYAPDSVRPDPQPSSDSPTKQRNGQF